MRHTLALVAVFGLSSLCFAQTPTSTTAPKKHKAVHAKEQALRMVPATVALDTDITSSTAKRGFEFKATLAEKVQLADGPLLPKGTKLIGTVAQDDQNVQGGTKLVLRFSDAVLKDGTKIPVKVMLVTVYKLDDNSYGEGTSAAGDAVPSSWGNGKLSIDQIGVQNGVDLHSRVGSSNSGVFVAAADHTIKLQEGSELALAISARIPGTQIAK